MNEYFQQNPMGQNNADVQLAVNAALKDEKKKRKKKRLIIIISVLAVIVLIVAVSGNDDNKKVETIETTTVSLSGNKGIEGQTEKAADEKIKPGTAVTVKDLKISYLSCNTNFKNYDQYAEPKSGHKIIRAEFNFENLGTEDKALSGFTCYADNTKCESYFFAEDYKDPILQTISPGRSTKGIVYYEVPVNAKDVELELEINIWTNEKLLFVVE